MSKSATELGALMREQDAFDRGLKARKNALRDQFAMAALTGMNVGSEWDASYCARRSYEIADAMLSARSQEGKA